MGDSLMSNLTDDRHGGEDAYEPEPVSETLHKSCLSLSDSIAGVV
jgi:hypothetical protein